MHVRQTFRRWWRIVEDPHRAFDTLPHRTFERVLVEYLLLLIVCALLGGAYILAQNYVRATYFSIVFDIEVDYWRLTNYAMGGVTAVVMFFIFAGTFLAFIASLFARPFAKRVSYVDTIATLMYALSPVLFFGWVLWLAPAMLVWSAVLFFTNIRVVRHARGKQKGTLQERE